MNPYRRAGKDPGGGRHPWANVNDHGSTSTTGLLTTDTSPLRARRITFGTGEDAMESCYRRGWSDGLPVVPPTPERVLRMLEGNVGGGRPGEVDRATLGNPGKYTFCFAEDEEGSPWEPLAVERGPSGPSFGSSRPANSSGIPKPGRGGGGNPGVTGLLAVRHSTMSDGATMRRSMGPGGLRGLQNRRRALGFAVRSIRTLLRQTIVRMG